MLMQLERIGTSFGVRPCGPQVRDSFGSRIAVAGAFRPDWSKARQREAVLMLSEIGLSSIGIGAHLGLEREDVEHLLAAVIEPEPAERRPDPGLSVAQLVCLSMIADLALHGRASISTRRIAAASGLSVGAVHRAVASLEKRGYLVASADRTGSTFRVTEKGRAAAVEAVS